VAAADLLAAADMVSDQSKSIKTFMNPQALHSLVATLALSQAVVLNAAQPFDSGSNGSYGPLNITNNTTLDMPTHGIFHCTTIMVASGTTLTFRRNDLNTPVYLLAQGDAVISGTIDVSGRNATGGTPGFGGPGGFDGGYGGFALATPGDGKGPGAGKGGGGGNAPATFSYGNALCVPLVGGSGGGGDNGTPGPGGGGGGGAILIASSTSITVNGVVVSHGGFGGCYGIGSAGAIRLVSPLVKGNGRVDVNYISPCAAGWGGRLRIDCLDRFAFRTLNLQASRGASATRGSQMFVFPSYNPHLDIIEAAGQPIPAGTTNSVSFELPPGPPTNIVVRVQGTDFTNNVPIRVVVTPENGSSASFDATIDISQGNPASSDVSVTLPAGTLSSIHAWTR